MLNKNRLMRLALFLILAFMVSGCAKYWQVQSSFNTAAKADTELAMGKTDQTLEKEGVLAMYKGIAETLTNTFIENQDKKLWANAYTIRAMCQVRTKRFDGAYESVEKGDACEIKWPRDTFLLGILKAQVFSGLAVQRYKDNGEKVSLADYGIVEADGVLGFSDPAEKGAPSTYRALFKKSMDSFGTTLALGSPPPDIKDYLYYQKYLALHNWLRISTRVADESDLELTQKARTLAVTDTGDLWVAMESARESIAPGSYLHGLIESLPQ